MGEWFGGDRVSWCRGYGSVSVTEGRDGVSDGAEVIGWHVSGVWALTGLLGASWTCLLGLVVGHKVGPVLVTQALDIWLSL